MTNHTAAATRQLELVELNSDGDPIGPVIRFPQDWPTAAERIDLTAATLDQAIARYRDWVTQSNTSLLVDVAPLGDDRTVRVVVISGRAWLARMSKPGGFVPAGERAPKPGERCECGREAITVYVTEKFGDVAYCGIPDGGAR